MINNWIDEKEIYPVEADDSKVVVFKEQYSLQDKFVIIYSRNICLYYDLENLMKVIESVNLGIKIADGREVVIAFVSAGLYWISWYPIKKRRTCYLFHIRIRMV